MEIREISGKITSLIWKTLCTNLLSNSSKFYLRFQILSRRKRQQLLVPLNMVFSKLYVHNLGEMEGGVSKVDVVHR